MTNYDKIMSMDSSELAEFLEGVLSGERDITGICISGCQEEKCNTCIEMWLSEEE